MPAPVLGTAPPPLRLTASTRRASSPSSPRLTPDTRGAPRPTSPRGAPPSLDCLPAVLYVVASSPAPAVPVLLHNRSLEPRRHPSSSTPVRALPSPFPSSAPCQPRRSLPVPALHVSARAREFAYARCAHRGPAPWSPCPTAPSARPLRVRAAPGHRAHAHAHQPPVAPLLRHAPRPAGPSPHHRGRPHLPAPSVASVRVRGARTR
nr:extensin-like [Aegilops tauschii subsp. strangulata]